jgi:hypothetical protein
MVVNLFVAIPGHHPGAHAKNFFAGIAAAIGWAIPSGPVWLAAHMVYVDASKPASLTASRPGHSPP